MLEFATATAAIATISSLVKLSDSIFDTWKKFKETRDVKKSDRDSFYEKIETTKDNDALIHSTDGRSAKKVTREELSKLLDANDAKVIGAIEKKMRILVGKWSAITEDYELVDANQKAIYKQRLDDICIELSSCLLQIAKLLERLGFALQDHYSAMKMIAETR